MKRTVGWAAVPLHRQAAAGDHILRGVLPAGAAGQWCAVNVRGPAPGGWWARLELTDEGRGQVVRAAFLPAARGRAGGCVRETLVHVPSGSVGVALRLFGATADHVALTLAVVPRWRAALALLWGGRRLIRSAWRGNPLGFVGRLRAMLGQAPARAGEAPPYAAWIVVCEGLLPPPPPAPALDVQVVILPNVVPGAVPGVVPGVVPGAVPGAVPGVVPGDGPAAGASAAAALDASLAALAAQTQPAARPPCLVRESAAWATCAGTWLVVLRAGDVLAPDALAWWAHAVAVFPHAACIFADFDEIMADGARWRPTFLPAPDAVFLRSALPARGPCLVRRPADLAALPLDAVAARAALAGLHPDRLAHVPRILAHCAPAISVAPPPVLPPAGGFAPPVVALLPSAARSRHVVRCVRALASATNYPNLRVDVLLSAPTAARGAVVRRLRAIPRVRVRHVPRAPFNFAAVNNAGAAGVDADLLLLLNDDVAPVSPGWLDAMVAHMRDPCVGVVGARLLYGNGVVQHEGVIMGLADLCEHAGRLRADDDGDAAAMGRVSREVSAVTAACMLVRSKLYHDLGGMDEEFAVALNDVDFCLRARKAGWRIVYCAEAELYHFESLSLGRHYEGARAGLERLEVGRLRARWAAEIADDPFYNPLAALEPGREWQPAFPPRGRAVVPRAANPAAVA